MTLHFQPSVKRPNGLVFLLISCTITFTAMISVLINPDAQADEPPLESLRFVQICDTQLGFGASGYDADVESFRQAVRQINKMQPDFVVVCGDLVNTPAADAFADFKKIASKLTIACHCAAGNHDIGSPLKPPLLDEYRATIGKDYYRFMCKGYTFIVVNTQLWKSPVASETEKHDRWLSDTLTEAHRQNSPVLVVGHHPLFLEAADEEEEYFNIPPAKRKEVLDLFARNGVVAVLSGHTHRLVNNSHQGIEFLSGETTSKNFDKRPLGFRLWEVGPTGKMSHRFVALDPKPVNGE